MKWLLISIAVFPAALNAAVYKCKADGETVYQASPCAKEGEEIRVRSTPASAPVQRSDDSGNDRPGVGGKNTTRHSERAYLAPQKEYKALSKEDAL